MKLILATILLFSFSANANFTMSDAILLCKRPNNPADILKNKGGHHFVNILALGNEPTRIRATMLWNPAVYNKSIKAAARPIGRIVVEMGYRKKGFDQPLYCKTHVSKVECMPLPCAAPPDGCNYNMDQADFDAEGCPTSCGPLVCSCPL